MNKLINNCLYLSKISKIVLFVSFLYGLFCVSELAVASNSNKNPHAKRIALLQLVEHPALDATRKGIEDEVRSAYKDIHIEFQSAQGNAALALQIAQKFVGLSPDVLVGIATLPAQALASANQNYAFPIVFSSVTDPVSARLVTDLKNQTGVVTGVSNYIDPGLQFKFFQEILPKLRRIGVIYNPGEPNSVTLNKQMERMARTLNLQIVLAPANTTAEVAQATQALMGKVDAVFINNDNTALSAFDSIVKIATENKTPVFCSDTDVVQQGALAALGPNQYVIGRQTGRMITRILKGERPDQIPVAFPEQTEIHLNKKAAEKLGITLGEALLQKATRVVSK